MVGEKNVAINKGYSAEIGVIMVTLGALITTLAYLRYRNIEKQLNNDSYFPSKWLSILVTLSIVIASLFLIFYLLPSIS
jgi:putative membrane protein